MNIEIKRFIQIEKIMTNVISNTDNFSEVKNLTKTERLFRWSSKQQGSNLTGHASKVWN